jgi:uncharacterized membrane protein YtjA (UPF0391 family)
MLGLAALFLVIAVVAALLGYSGLAGDMANIAWVMVIIFAVLFVVAAISNAISGRRTPAP